MMASSAWLAFKMANLHTRMNRFGKNSDLAKHIRKKLLKEAKVAIVTWGALSFIEVMFILLVTAALNQ